MGDHDREERTDVFGAFSRNEPTYVPGDLRSEPRTPVGPRESFLIAYDRLAELTSAARRPAFAIAAVDGRSRVVAAELLETGSSLAIGRHTKCRVRLLSEAISLRHVVALALPGAAGAAPVLRVWDLNTGLPFRTEDGQDNGAVASEGATYLSIGQFALWFLPCGPGRPWPARGAEAWKALPQRSFVDRRSPVSRDKRAGMNALPRPRHEPMREERTWVTSYGPPLLLGGGGEDEPEIAWGTIRLQSGTSKARRKVSAERLEQGILVGRYERCGLSLGQIDINVSRVHLLLVRIGADVWAIDTGSSNGVRRKGEAVEAVILANNDQLEFGSGMVLNWSKMEHAEA
jgi:hypothetical protein